MGTFGMVNESNIIKCNASVIGGIIFLKKYWRHNK
jgi:hypothetical protein